MQLLSKDREESGIVLILLAISITTIIGFIGLAIDIGNLYRTGLHVQKAADAGSLAAILFRINNSTESAANIELRAERIAFANLQVSGVAAPTEALNIIDGATSTEWVPATQKMFLTVKDVTKMFLLSSFVKGVSQTFTTQRTAESELGRANVSLIIDISGSMDCPGVSTVLTDPLGPLCQCRLNSSCPAPNAGNTSAAKIDKLQDAIAGTNGFLSQFSTTRDRINIVAFNNAASLVRSVRTTPSNTGTDTDNNDAVIDGFTLATLQASVNALDPKSGTNIADGLITAFDDFRSVSATDTGSKKEEVFYVLFSDGAPTATSVLLEPGGTDSLDGKYYQIFGVDFVNAGGAATKGTSPFIGRIPPFSSASLLTNFSLFNRERTDTFTTTPGSGSGFESASAKFVCGATNNPVTGCDIVEEEDGELEVERHECTAFNTAFQTSCTGTDFTFRIHPTASTAIYEKAELRDIYKLFYDVPIAVSDMMRKNKGTIYAIGLGQPGVEGTDEYQNEYNSFIRKDIFMRRLVSGQNEAGKAFDEFTLDSGASDQVSARDRRGIYLSTASATELRNLYLKIAQKILINLVK